MCEQPANPDRAFMVDRLTGMCKGLADEIDADAVLVVTNDNQVVAASAPNLRFGDERKSFVLIAGQHAKLVVRISGSARRALERSIAGAKGASADPSGAVTSAVAFAERLVGAYVKSSDAAAKEFPPRQ